LVPARFDNLNTH
jgi:DDE superfamily endonuclease